MYQFYRFYVSILCINFIGFMYQSNFSLEAGANLGGGDQPSNFYKGVFGANIY